MSDKNKYVDLLSLLSAVDGVTRKEFIQDMIIYNVCCFIKDDTGRITRVPPSEAGDDVYMAFNPMVMGKA
jgi:hypothetical protein